ncbi:glycine--tRNA ligase [Halobaculum sp. MBLA0147]|uniref:glycine--tRNA ligase n=1 Tax=Halobaculum sp. MBLA0147 TaxID=3079934 RepID=UPI003525B8BC
MADRERLAELAKRRGFFFGSVGAYGGVAGFQTYGPQGASLKDNVETAWRDRFTVKEGNHEIEAPTVMPEAVFQASGHLDGFDDMLVRCSECATAHRADHLIEDATEIEEAESMPTDEAETLIADHEIACPECGTPLAGQPVEEFNLMFDTEIGPGTGQSGYLRPETAQGIFVEFPRLKEYARNSLPFGVTQIGPGYRNEISPRGGLERLREFTMAELEQFVHPEDDGPSLEPVADVTLPLYAAPDQADDDGGVRELTVREAVDEGVVASEWIAYYLGVALRWYDRVGVDLDRFRFRQHNPGELAHYASDCWDAEALLGAPADASRGDPQGGDWVEIAGFADRGDYDLSKHAESSDERYTVFREYDEPKTVERTTVDPDMSVLGPEFGGDAGAVAAALETLADRDPDAFDGDEVTVEVDGESVTVDTEVANFGVETVTEAGEHVTPHVMEPSFGVDRTVLTLVDHAVRDDEVDGEERTYLALDPEVAPTTAAVFPLVSNDDRLVALADDVADALRERGLAVAEDDSGSIGRRYRRQDEVGTPFCVTVDRDGVESDGPDTVTLRERDTAAQVRLPVDDVAAEVAALVDAETETTFADLTDRYTVVAAGRLSEAAADAES